MNVIYHDQKNHLFYSEVGNEQMMLEYTKISPGLIDFTSTFVPKPYRNQGLGSKLVEAGLNYAKDKGFQVRASCPFVADFASEHHRYRYMLRD